MSRNESVRERLRVVTEPAHERLHHHPGFAAAASGEIALDDYRRLLSRLYGFHQAFEEACEAGPFALGDENRARAPMLVEDLESLGLEPSEIARLPRPDGLPVPASEAEWLGSSYVIEGSTLGGVYIARALKALFPHGDGVGRRFFLGYGERHGAMWRSFLERLERVGSNADSARTMVDAAVRTFDEFEAWMVDWRGPRAAKSVAAE